MGEAQCGVQIPIDPLRDSLNLSSFLSTQCCLMLQVSSTLCLSTSCFTVFSLLSFSLSSFLSSLFFIIICSLSVHGLKLIYLTIVQFLFRPFRSPTTVCLELPASTSSSMAHREWPLLLSRTAPSLPH